MFLSRAQIRVVAVRSRTGLSSRAFSEASVASPIPTKSIVPTIDVSALQNGSLNEKKAVAKEIGKACEDIGFFTIVNHGVSNEVIDQCWSTTKMYFDLNETDKQVEMSEDYPYGYCGFGVEVLSAGKAKETGETMVVAPDLKESFSIGPYNPKSNMPAQRWPRELPQMQADWNAYYRQLEQLSARLLTGCALALDLPENWFENKTDRHCSAMRALNYPAMTMRGEHEGQMRASSHTDYGALTILRQDGPGLQVNNRQGEWADVPVVPDAFIINLGDLMSRWTNDKWISTPHRVQPPPVGSSSPRRQSIAFFHNINNDHLVSCIDTCASAASPAKYPPVVAQDHLMQKHLAAVGAVGSKEEGGDTA